MNTEKLIVQLAEVAVPVQRLSRPLARTAVWLLISIPYVGLVMLVVSPRDDLIAMMWTARFTVELSAALATAVTAAYAAFVSIIPGHNRKVLLLPLLPLAIWLGSLTQGCLQAWLGPESLSLWSDWFCLPAIVLTGAIPAVAMAAMLRRGAPLTPHLSTALGVLAAAGLGNVGLRLFHVQDASLMVLVWQVGTVFALTAAAALVGRQLLNWRSIIGHTAPGAVWHGRA